VDAVVDLALCEVGEQADGVAGAPPAPHGWARDRDADVGPGLEAVEGHLIEGREDGSAVDPLVGEDRAALQRVRGVGVPVVGCDAMRRDG
jgi:hypothetical protein